MMLFFFLLIKLSRQFLALILASFISVHACVAAFFRQTVGIRDILPSVRGSSIPSSCPLVKSSVPKGRKSRGYMSILVGASPLVAVAALPASSVDGESACRGNFLC